MRNYELHLPIRTGEITISSFKFWRESREWLIAYQEAFVIGTELTSGQSGSGSALDPLKGCNAVQQLDGMTGTHPLKSRERARGAGVMLRWQAIPYYRRRRCLGVHLDRAVDAAIDDDRLTGAVAGLRRAEISTEIADFVRLSHSPQRNCFGEEPELFVHCYAQGLRSSGKYLDEAIGHYGTRSSLAQPPHHHKDASRVGA
jgi:hypothetical protein